ncbi:MAG: hypothetical protein WCD04_06130, partial [Terriglobia bacterium]
MSIAIEPGFRVMPCCPNPSVVQGCHPEPGNTRQRLAGLRPLVPSPKPLARISHQLSGIGFEGAQSGDCGLTL